MSHVGAQCKGEEMVPFPSNELPSGLPAFLAPPLLCPIKPHPEREPSDFFPAEAIKFGYFCLRWFESFCPGW